MRAFIAVTIATATLTLSALATAQEHSAQCRDAGSDADHTYCFEPETVGASLVGASGQGVRILRPGHGPSLLRIRAHFVPEMMKSVEAF